MIIGCDFGITNTDVVLRKADGSERFFSFASNQVNGEISAIIDLLGNNIDVATIDKIYVTGGKSSDLPKKFLKKEVLHINEIFAIGNGARKIYQFQDNALIVSTGSGTTCVTYKDGDYALLGGISMGGGTLDGMSSLVLDSISSTELDNLANNGDLKKTDLKIGDVVNQIGNLSNDVTAVNLGKLKRSDNFSDDDIALAICNMVGEVIGTVAYLNAFLLGTSEVYFVGRTSLLSNVRIGIEKRLEIAGINGCFGKNREYANAIGCMSD